MITNRRIRASFAALASMLLLLSLSTSANAAVWGYGDMDAWDENYPECGGQRQSPIDIVTGAVDYGNIPVIHMDFRYKRSVASNNGHAINVSGTEGKSIVVGGETYTLVQFHFHTLSEHTVDGKHYDMELHLVHGNDDFINGNEGGKLAVLGVFIEKGEKNTILADLLENLPAYEEGEYPEEVEVLISNYYSLLPANKGMYSYSGSLTTPGCNEIVSWYVMAEPISMSEEQIETYRGLYLSGGEDDLHTNREVQPLNGRIVSYSELDSNSAPVFTGDIQSEYTVVAGETLTIEFTASDPDGESVSVTGNNLPDGFSSSTGGTGSITLEFTPQAEDEGTYDISVKADDGTNSTSLELVINVALEHNPAAGDVPTLSEWGFIFLAIGILALFSRKRAFIRDLSL